MVFDFIQLKLHNDHRMKMSSLFADMSCPFSSNTVLEILNQKYLFLSRQLKGGSGVAAILPSHNLEGEFLNPAKQFCSGCWFSCVELIHARILVIRQ